MPRIGSTSSAASVKKAAAKKSMKTKPFTNPAMSAPWAAEQSRGPAPSGLEPSDIRGHVYRSSEMGACVTALAAIAGGFATPADLPDSLKGAAQEGVDNEPVILSLLRNERKLRSVTYPEIAQMKEDGQIAGYGPQRQEIQVRSQMLPGVWVRGHLDDMMLPEASEALWSQDVPELVIVEAKAFAQSTWDAWLKKGFDGFERYAWQLASNMLCVEAMFGYPIPALFVVGLKDEQTRLVSEIDITQVSTPPIEMGEFKAKLMKAEAAIKRGELRQCDVGNWPCPVYFLDVCVGAKKDVPQDVEDDEFGQMIATFTALKLDEKETKAELDKVKTRIEKHMAEKGYERKVKYRVWSPTHERFVFEWVEQSVDAETEPRKATVRSYPSAKIVETE